MRAWLAIISLLACPAAAHAMGATMLRHPVSSSIPCKGQLSEVRAEEGNVYNAFNSLILTCADRPNHAQWVIRAEAGCNIDNDDETAKLDDACAKDISEPVGRFFTSPQRQPTLHQYSLGRYVFASDCEAVPYVSKTMEAVTNKVASTSKLKGWVCHQINKVNGVSSYDAQTGKVNPKGFRYAYITTRGPEEKLDNGDGGNDVLSIWDILGVADSDTHYQVRAVGGVASNN